MKHKKQVVITRPIADARETASLLANHNIDSFIEPLISISTIISAKPEILSKLDKIDGVIITSKNALRALNKLQISINISMICLGEKTYQYAKELGFTGAKFCGENSSELLQYINTQYNNKNLIYISGEIITTDFAKIKSNAQISKIIIYKTINQVRLSDNFKNKLRDNHFSLILIFSKNSAQIFYNLLKKEGMIKYIHNLSAACLSNNIEQTIQDYGFLATICAQKANQDSLIQATIDFLFAQEKY